MTRSPSPSRGRGDVQRLAGDERRVVAGQERDRGGDLLGLPDPTHGRRGDHALHEPLPDLAELLRGGGQERCVDRSGRDGVHPHPEPRGLARDRAREADHPGLGRRVDRRALRADPAGLGRDVDDRARAAALHPVEHGVRDRDRAAQVDADHVVPQRLVGVDEEREAVGARVVDEHVERPERVLGNRHPGTRGGSVGDVHLHRDAVDLAGHVARTGLVEVGHRHPRALGGQPPGGGRADPRRAAGDERDPTLESHRRSLVAKWGRRCRAPY
jgi:hypothetical protein